MIEVKNNFISSSVQVLLINPNRIIPPVAPLALEYLSDALAKCNISYNIIDFCFEKEPIRTIKNIINQNTITCIGITIRNTDNSCFPNSEYFLPEIKNLVSILKSISPEVPIVVGGSGFSTMPEKIIDFCKADYGIIGASSDSFPILVNQLMNKTKVQVPGLVKYESSKNITINEPLKNSPIPNLKRDLDMNRKYFKKSGIVGIETKIGCNFSCIYCIDPISKCHKIKQKNIDNIGNEFSDFLSIGINNFHICDSEFNDPLNHAIDVCKEIYKRSKGKEIGWYCYATPAYFSEELGFWLQKSKCNGVIFCSDHCDDSMLLYLNKQFTYRDIVTSSSICSKYKIPQLHCILLGGPGENHESIKTCIEKIKIVKTDIIKINVGFRVYPNTQLESRIKTNNYSLINQYGKIINQRKDNLLEPAFFISKDILDDHNFDLFVRNIINEDRRFIFYGIQSQSNRAAYHYDWMKLKEIYNN